MPFIPPPPRILHWDCWTKKMNGKQTNAGLPRKAAVEMVVVKQSKIC